VDAQTPTTRARPAGGVQVQRATMPAPAIATAARRFDHLDLDLRELPLSQLVR